MEDNKDMLFSELLNEWLISKKMGIEPLTYESYKRQIANIAKNFAGKTVKEISIQTLQKYYASEIDRGLSVNSIKHAHHLISPALDYAMNILRIIDINPGVYIKLPKIKPYIGNIMEPETINIILKQVKDTPIEVPIFLAAVYGLRRSEVVGLRWNNIDFKNKIFTIKNTLRRERLNGEIQNIERNYGKTSSSLRQFPILDEFFELLTRIRENHKIYKKNNPGYTSKYKDFLCLDIKGEVLRPDFISKKFQRILQKNDLPIIRFHDLRHSCATYLYNLGIQIKDIQLWLGHGSISTTMNIYTHLNHRNKLETAEKMKSFFKKE